MRRLLYFIVTNLTLITTESIRLSCVILEKNEVYLYHECLDLYGFKKLLHKLNNETGKVFNSVIDTQWFNQNHVCT